MAYMVTILVNSNLLVDSRTCGNLCERVFGKFSKSAHGELRVEVNDS